MKPEAEQPNALGKRVKRGQQRLPGSHESLLVGNVCREALRPGDDGEIAVFYLERDRPSRHLGTPHTVPGVAGDALELGRQPVGVAQILIEGALGADRLVGTVGPDLALVDPAADAPIPLARAAEL